MVMIKPTPITKAVTACQRVKYWNWRLDISNNSRLQEHDGSKSKVKEPVPFDRHGNQIISHSNVANFSKIMRSIVCQVVT